MWNWVRNVNHTQIPARDRLSKRDPRSPFSRTVLHWTIENCLDFVFCDVVTVDVRLAGPRIIVIAYLHLDILLRRPYLRPNESDVTGLVRLTDWR